MREQIRAELKRRGIKHKWIIDRLGISKSHFSHWLKGEREISVAHQKAILKMLEEH